MLDGTSSIFLLITSIICLGAGIFIVRSPGWLESKKRRSQNDENLTGSYKGLHSIGGVTLIIIAVALLVIVAVSWIGDLSDEMQRAASLANLESYSEPYGPATDGNLYRYDQSSEIATGGNLQ